MRERASAYEYQAVPVTYSVNSNGNETARGADTVTYDQANRLTSVGLAGVQTFQYTFPLRKSGPGVGGWNRSSYVGNNPQPSETLVV